MEIKSVVRAMLSSMPYIAYNLPTTTFGRFNAARIARARKRGQTKRARRKWGK